MEDSIKKFCTLVSKGQVWMVKEEHGISQLKLKYKSKIIRKTRPYYIISSEDNDDIIQAIPITSSNGHNYKYSVTFTGMDNITEKVVISQITVIEKKNLLRYMYTVSDSIVDIIDRCIIDHFELGRLFMEKPDNIQQNISIDKSELPISDKAENTSNIDVKKDNKNSHISKRATKKNSIKNSDTIDIYTIRHRYERFTDSLMMSFINDYNMLSKDELATKYGIIRKDVKRTYDRLILRSQQSKKTTVKI